MDYPDSVRFLYSLGNELKVGAKFGLERIRTLLAALGNPEAGQRYVHVAGTNGKGSTCSAIESILRRAGYRTGLYTSPHLQQPTERIWMAGAAVSPQAFASAFEQVHRIAEQLLAEDAIDAYPSYFETVTAMGLLLFRDACDLSVIEVGLGGRLDATNVILPEISVVTSVSFDHEAYLGNTLEAIASEKAGIIKPGVPVVLAKQSSAAAAVLEARAAELGSPVIRCDDYSVEAISLGNDGTTFHLDGQRYFVSLAGRHQVDNATAAILTCRHLGVSEPAIQSGLAAVRWPGRLERIHQKPDVFLDGAHNPAGAAALAEYIRAVYAGRPVWIVYGAMRDKAIDEVIGHLFPLADRLILTAPKMPRALRPQAIAEMTDHPNLTIVETVADAVHLSCAAPPDTAVFLTGSLFLVGEAREAVAQRR